MMSPKEETKFLICGTPVGKGQWNNHQEHCHKSLRNLQT